MVDYPLLQGLVKTKFGSVNNFADKMGFSRNYTSLLLNGKRKMTLELAEAISDALGLEEIGSKNSIMDVFFARDVAKSQHDSTI